MAEPGIAPPTLQLGKDLFYFLDHSHHNNAVGNTIDVDINSTSHKAKGNKICKNKCNVRRGKKGKRNIKWHEGEWYMRRQ